MNTRGDNMDIGQRIRMRREELGISQEELALKAGYKSRSSINKIEKDGRGLPQSKILLIAKALNTTPSYLMGWEEPFSEESAIIDAQIVNDKYIKRIYYHWINLSEIGKKKVMDNIEDLSKIYSIDTSKNISCVVEKPAPYEANAAHERTDIEVTDEMRMQDDDIMNDENF